MTEQQERVSLDDILPRREWVTLTEAATAIAFGAAMTATEYAAARQHAFDEAAQEYRRDASATVAAAKLAGWSGNSLHEEEGIDRPSIPVEIKQFQARCEIRSALQREHDQAFYGALGNLLAEGRAGRLTLAGCADGEGRRLTMSTLDLTGTRALKDIDLDTLYDPGGRIEWCQVVVERARLIGPRKPSPGSTQASCGDTGVVLPGLQADILRGVEELWPDGKLPGRKTDRNQALLRWFEALGLTLPDERTIRRTLKKDKTGQ